MTMPAQEAAPTIQERRAARRANQTTFNLVIALVASLGVVLLLVLVVVRPDMENKTVDWIAEGELAQRSVEQTLAVPDLPEGWAANRATLVPDPADGVARWEVGFLTPGGEFIALVQGIEANASWLAAETKNERPTGTATLGGLTWDAYDLRETPDPGNYEYVLSTLEGDSTIVLHGTATDAEFEILATAVAEALS